MKKTLGLAVALGSVALLCSGCSNQTVVIGNLASMFVTFGLFYTTLNLRGDR